MGATLHRKKRKIPRNSGPPRPAGLYHRLHRPSWNQGDAAPLFPTAYRNTKTLTTNPMSGDDIGHMVKRRIKDAGLPKNLSPHSFRATTATDLINQGVPLEDVQHLLGHTLTPEQRSSTTGHEEKLHEISSSESQFARTSPLPLDRRLLPVRPVASQTPTILPIAGCQHLTCRTTWSYVTFYCYVHQPQTESNHIDRPSGLSVRIPPPVRNPSPVRRGTRPPCHRARTRHLPVGPRPGQFSKRRECPLFIEP